MMPQLIRNEWCKLRRERGLWFALVLHLAPWTMVAGAGLAGIAPGGPSRYFILHNQSMLVTGLVACVVTSIAFQVELGNRTWFDWLTLPHGATRLVTAKLCAVVGVLVSFVVLSTTLMLGLMLLSGAGAEIWRMTLAYVVLQCGTFAIMVVVAAALCVLTRNVVVVNIVGVALGMVTVVVMAADFSWILPTAWPYRCGLALLSEDYAYPWAGAAPSGAAVHASCTAIALWATVLGARDPRVVNAPTR